jgi:hypothetical protein
VEQHLPESDEGAANLRIHSWTVMPLNRKDLLPRHARILLYVVLPAHPIDRVSFDDTGVCRVA